MSEHALTELGRRIERLTLSPDSISAPLHRLFRGVLHRIGWKPSTDVDALLAIVELLRAPPGDEDARARSAKTLEAAIDELEDNVKQVERATVIAERPLVSHAAWLRRCYELVVVAHRALADQKALPPAEGEEVDDAGTRMVATMRDEALLAPPLAMGRARRGADLDKDDDAANESIADPGRVLELQLDTIDHLMAAAREDDALLGRRRRLLHAARQLLLETSAALRLDQDGVQQRLQNIAKQITLTNRYEALGLRHDVGLLHQARTALSRGERDRLFGALSLLRRRAADVGDVEVTKLTSAAIDRLVGQTPTSGDREASMVRSGREVLGARVVGAIEAGYERARSEEGEIDSFAGAVIKQYFAPGREHDTVAHALAVDGCFEVGGTLSPIRIHEEFIVNRLVPYPTQRLELVKASGPGDLETAVIHDPRMVVLDLAAGRLLARRFVRDEVATRPKTVMQGEVRVYVLDGSTSMLGPRARMRDAILVAELATLLERLENPDGHTRVLLFYRYFTSEMGPVTRVDSPARSVEAIRNVVATPRSGGTDIEGALLSSMELIAQAKENDSELARAQIVVVTDGEAPVNYRNLRAARETVGDLPVNISVIALGNENTALRDIVAHQRAQGERAFYHFMPDEHLEQLSEREIDGEVMVHLPVVPQRGDAGQMHEDVDALLQQLSDLQRSREAEALRDLDRTDREQRVDPSALQMAGEGERARLEALYRDDVALDRRYERWFPRPAQQPRYGEQLRQAMPPEGTRERDDLDSLLVVFSTIAEVVETVGSYRRGRQADAVDMLERLLPDARLTPGRYHELLGAYPAVVSAGLTAVHASARSGLGWTLEAGSRRVV